ncbi:hypothetical protein MN608_04618 [Microdochium nivale]|nr:hypothetical protein MN608_04618 [Microdochium nivale]
MQEWARQRLSFAGRPSRAVSLAGWPPLHPLATAARRPAREMPSGVAAFSFARFLFSPKCQTANAGLHILLSAADIRSQLLNPSNDATPYTSVRGQ